MKEANIMIQVLMRNSLKNWSKIPAEVKETIKQRATSETRWQFERILLPSEIKAQTD
jgi:hypothetical protein